jgi:cytidylate kinase
MTAHAYLDHGMAILKARLESPAAVSSGAAHAVPPFLTLSREVCAGATTLGSLLLPQLNAEFGEEGHEWLLLDKDLVSYALSRHQLSERLAEYLPEDQVSEIDAAIGEIVGLHPSIWKLEHQVAQTIVQLAHLGRVIFVGRAAHLLTQPMPGGFHVRLVAARETRIRRFTGMQGCGASEARLRIDRMDDGRRRFVKSHFDREIDDPHFYDLVINTDRISPETAATLVMEGLRHRMSAAGAAAPADGPARAELAPPLIR